MKKYLLIVFCALSGYSLVAQDIETVNAETHLSALTGTAAADQLTCHIDVLNDSNDPLEIRCSREIITQEAASSTEQFCWAGFCYPAGSDTSLFTLNVAPGVTIPSSPDAGFTGYYMYGGEEGVCQIRYCFTDISDPSNSTCIDVNYCVNTVGFCNTFLGTEEIIEETVLGQVSPNPASSNFLVSYKLGSKAVNTELIIMNAVGKEVRNVKLSSRTGVLNFDATDLPTGMYFYTIKNNGKTEATKKFIVSH